jgi:hypothetical protein
VVVNEDALFLLGGDGGGGLEVLGPAAITLGVAIGEDDLGLDLLGLAREDHLPVVLVALAPILQVLHED